MSKKKIQVESTQKLWRDFIKFKIIFFEKSNATLGLEDLEKQKKKLLDK
jgi:hypothetical protein